MKLFTAAVVLTIAGLAAPARAQAPLPAATEGDFIARDFRFGSGETLPSLKLHYRTLGAARRDASGTVRNAVMVLHGTAPSAASCSAPDNCSMRRNISSSCRTASGTGSRASRATAFTRGFRNTPTTTWCARSTRCSSRASA